jgi:hypothetical protein
MGKEAEGGRNSTNQAKRKKKKQKLIAHEGRRASAENKVEVAT